MLLPLYIKDTNQHLKQQNNLTISISLLWDQGADFKNNQNNKTIKQFLFGPIGR